MAKTDTDILDEKQIAEIETHYEISIDSKFASSQIPALCQTVRALRSMVYVPKILPDDEEITYQQQSERLLREKVELQSKLVDVEQERNAETKHAGRWETRTKQLGHEVEGLEQSKNDFRTRAIQLCRDKAAEWEGRTDQSMSSCALQLGDQLEKL